MKTVLKNCRLIPELSGGYDKTYADVVLHGGKIADVCAPGNGGQADYTIDCSGKTLLPGLFDIHTHLNWDYYTGVTKINDFKLLTNSCLSAKRFLPLGITTIRDMGTAKHLSVHVRNAIRQGLFIGPRILCSGTVLHPTNSSFDSDPNSFLRFVSGEQEIIKAAREYIGDGADFVKLYLPGDPPEMLPEEVRAAVRIAHLRGRRVAAHAHDTSAVRLALDEGVDTIEHASFVDEDCIELLKAGGSHLVPTLTVLSPLVETPGYTKERKKELLAPLLEANVKNISAAYRAGLVMGLGTDTPVERLAEKVGLEFQMRHELCGMKPVDVLLQATKYSALLCGLEDVTGEVRSGLAADLIVVNGNPDEDMSVMYQRPEKVFLEGREMI